MQRAPKYHVEQEETTVFVLGKSPIEKALLSAFQEKGVGKTTNVDTADYVICWGVAPDFSTPGRQIIIHTYDKWEPPSTQKTNARHIYLGSLYGEPIHEFVLGEMANSAKEQGVINIPQDGVGKHYLLDIDYAVSGIVAATLHPRGREVVYLLGTSHSLLSLAYHLREIYPKQIKVNFNSINSFQEKVIDWTAVASGLEPLKLPHVEENPDLRPYLKYLLSAQQPIRQPTQQAQQVVPPSAPQVKLTKFQPLAEPQTKPKKTPKLQRIEFEPIKPAKHSLKSFKIPKLKYALPRFHSTLLTNIIAVVLIVFILYGSSLLLAILGLSQAIITFRSSILDNSTKSNNSLGLLSASYLMANLNTYSLLPPLHNQATTYYRLVDGASQALSMEKELVALSQHGKLIVDHVLGQTDSTSLVSSLTQSRLLIETVYNKLSLVQATLPQELPSLVQSRFGARYDSGLLELRSLKSQILTGKALLAIVPDLIGVGERRQYALLLQNNMELRPTGGFIGSFALGNFDNGRLFDLPVYDVYQADGQLKGYIEPPLPIKKYLGEANWFLRDSNWDPDFPTTASRVSWYIKKTINQDVDGVVGINLSVISKVIDALGSLYVPEFDETITVDNLYTRTQYHSEVGFFPGSTQKKEFISSLVSALMVRLHNADITTQLKIIEGLYQAIENHDITVSVNNQTSQEVIRRLGWAGDIKTANCPTDNCIASYISVVDANVGVNKTNFYLKRNLNLVVDLDKNLESTHRFTISQENTATSNAWPAGSYKNYQRLYLPISAKLISLTRDGVAIPERDIDTQVEHNKLVIGYLVTTPVSGTSEIVATYRLPSSLAPQTPSFSFYWQKQPGTTIDPLTITVNYPIYLNPTAISPAGQSNPQQLIFDLDNSSDRQVLVNFNAK